MLLRFRLEEFKDFVRHLIVRRQRVKVRARWCCRNGRVDLLGGKPFTRFRLGKVQRGRFRGECEAIALFEIGNIIESLFAGVANFQEIGFQQRNSIRKKFRQRSM